MNVERADPSYTAWDNAIVAKSKGQRIETAGKPAAPGAQQASHADQKPARSEKAFDKALSYANDHEHAYDETQRSETEETLSFWDFVDIINPLQHIPVVSTIYRELTGDEISAPARIAGGMLYGGPLGFASSIGNAIVEETSGKDVGEIALALFRGDEDTPAAPSEEGTALASAASGPSNVTAAAPVQPATQEAALQQAPAQTPSAQAQPPQTENAGATAVSQMQANNAALQALLKDMGLSQQTPAAGAGKPAPALASSDSSGAVDLDRASIGGAPQQRASAGGVVNRPAAPAPTPASTSTPAPGSAQQQAAMTGPAPATAQDEAEPERKSFPIDPSRYINTRAVSRAPAANVASQTTALNRTVAQTPENAAATPSESLVKAAASGQIPEQDRTALQSSFADRMLDALDRYQSMSKERSDLPDIGSGNLPGRTPGAI